MRRAEQLADALLQRNWRLVTAESCTGGLICAQLTDIPGSSGWLEGGFVTYTPEMKVRVLGVRQSTLDRWGVVSEPTAAEMALGALKLSGANLSVSVTGVAGPSGGDVTIPVGTVWFGWALSVGDSPPTVMHTAVERFSGSRELIRDAAVEAALAGCERCLADPDLR